MIERPDCLQKLIQYKDKDIIKVITGVSRCGKSYLLFNIFNNYLTDNSVNKNQIIMINLEKFINKISESLYI